MDYLVGERGGKWDQLQCEMHMVAHVRGHRKNCMGFPFCMNELQECYSHLVRMYFLPAAEGRFGFGQRLTGH